MITASERAYIIEHAYVPEHLPHYVTAISQTEPFLVGDFVVHVVGTQLIFVGYSLSENFNEAQLLESLEEAKALFKPETVSIIAPALPIALADYTLSAPDAYYRIDVQHLSIPQKTRNMLARARQEVSISLGRFGREHKKLVADFLRTHSLESSAKFIFQRIDEYEKYDATLLFEARNTQGALVAFDVAEFGAQQYAFYMFNIRSRKHNIPGTSDLLLAHIIDHAKAEGKRYINQGLGINPGITFFKKKWSATQFLNYAAGMHGSNKKELWGEIFNQLSGL